jgi:hypothetical protein
MISTTEVSMSTTEQEMVLAHFIVSADVERSRRFSTDVLGGRTVVSGEGTDGVTYVALANSWIIINVGGGPTDDKPDVTLEPPPDPDRVTCREWGDPPGLGSEQAGPARSVGCRRPLVIPWMG